MQNKGFISVIAGLLVLICGFYISFSFVTRHYENEAKAYAAKMSKTTDETNDAYKQSLKHAITLLTDRGRCPGDLLQMIFRQGWLTDALFAGSTDPSEVSKHQDLIARCFLQLYYRGD